MGNRCSREDCEREAQYVCLCLPSKTLLCEIHLNWHISLPNRNHVLDSILPELNKLSKKGILTFLENEKFKKETLKRISLSFDTQNNPEISIKKDLNELDSDLSEIINLIEKISQISEENSLVLQPNSDAERAENMVSSDSDSHIKLLHRLIELRNKRWSILDKTNNDIKIEQDFKKTCEFYDNIATNGLLREAYKEYVKAYQKITSLYYASINWDTANLIIYDTKSERERKCKQVSCRLNQYSYIKCIIPLPNGEFFASGKDSNNSWMDDDDTESSIPFIIDRNYRVKEVAPWKNKCFLFTAIYFNRSIYCFGIDFGGYSRFLFARKLDLEFNKWFDFTPMQQWCKNENSEWWSIIFNRNILISETRNCNILLYSIDIDSFSLIPYQFSDNARKILINAESRIYLIEYGGWIYESGVSNEFNWEKNCFSGNLLEGEIAQIYCSYNNGGIYISAYKREARQYFKFDLSQKILIDIALYTSSSEISLRRLNGKIEIDSKNCKLNPEFIKNERTLYYIAQNLEELEKINAIIKRNTQYECVHRKKVDILEGLGQNFEAKNYLDAYNDYLKGVALHDLNENLKAIECYNESIRLEPEFPMAYLGKGEALHDLGQNIEALECYNKAINISPSDDNAYFRKACVLHDLGQNFEAIACNNEAIRLSPNTPLYFCNRAYIFNDLGEVEAAINDLNEAHEYMSRSSINNDWDSALISDYLGLLKILSKLLEIALKIKEKQKSIKNTRIKNHKEAEEKEFIDKCSQLIKRAVKCLNLNRNKAIEELPQIEKEVYELQNAMI